ncbi:MAG: pyruvate formate-lyase [Lentisphaeria bacterium]|nr:pyruvate formate-lyase [Lentisphaeria bacterium]
MLSECESEGLSWGWRVARLFVRQCEAEVPVIRPDERIAFERTVPSVAAIYGEADRRRLFSGRRAHELGPISNICADWGRVLGEGLLGRRAAALASRSRLAGDDTALGFLDQAVCCIDALLALVGRYAEAAEREGRADLAGMLRQVPAHPPRGFAEALQALRILHASVWLCGHYHVGLGRFDQYMMPYLRRDLDAGTLTEAEAEDWLAEFFISLNRDTDLYPGVQQGDNGQSLMLGGVTRDGADAVNLLTRMVLKVARRVSMIDPKINLRVHGETPLELLELAAQLTRMGLGFPQYSNDEVVIPALLAHGYRPEDARDYTVAACWEYIIPGRGMEVVNIGAVSFPAAADRAIRAGLEQGDGMGGILERVRAEIRSQVEARVREYRTLLLPPAPWYSVLMTDCLERGRDLSQGATYNNFGLHGACGSNAADALAAVQLRVFEEERVPAAMLLAALAHDWRGYENIRETMASGPKVGNDDPAADGMLCFLFDAFADACEAAGDNGRGGRVRPGTGSAMYYIWLAQGHEGMGEPSVGATADGRREGDFFSSSLAPSPGAAVRGPLSILQSFAKLDYGRICNGGPITLELSDAVFRNAEAVRKVAMLVRTFARLGCQQLQLNTLNAERLRDAKAHPEEHRNLIVRVWGWSGYFCELAPEYQDHIIARQMHRV